MLANRQTQRRDMESVERKLVYISHSLNDRAWLDRLLSVLAPYDRDLGLGFWADALSIVPGESWDQAREQALGGATVVVLLVSRSCLESRFLTQHEWPRIQAKAQQGWSLLFIVTVDRSELPEWMARFQRLPGNDRTLEDLRGVELEAALAEIARKIAEAAGVTPPHRSKRIRIPDIAWVEIPGGPFLYQHGEARELPTFWIARHPITNLQYQTFIDDGGYREERWWRDLKRPEPQESRWQQPNRPRTNVDWFEAVAFSRWLCARLGLKEGELRLPSEEEWEKAARGPKGLAYPWGENYRSGFANVDEKALAGPWHLEQTTAVGLYPHGRSPNGVEDLAGTVWEWCLNKYDKPEDVIVDSGEDRRVLRGGSWLNDPNSARADDRGRYPPGDRLFNLGFRLVSVVHIASADR